MKNRFKNIKDGKVNHFEIKSDKEKAQRYSLFNLLEPTLENPQVAWVKDGKNKYARKFINENGKAFYVFVTKDNDEFFITHFSNARDDYIARQILDAD